jgi:hypothetical protein
VHEGRPDPPLQTLPQRGVRRRAACSWTLPALIPHALPPALPLSAPALRCLHGCQPARTLTLATRASRW